MAFKLCLQSQFAATLETFINFSGFIRRFLRIKTISVIFKCKSLCMSSYEQIKRFSSPVWELTFLLTWYNMGTSFSVQNFYTGFVLQRYKDPSCHGFYLKVKSASENHLILLALLTKILLIVGAGSQIQTGLLLQASGLFQLDTGLYLEAQDFMSLPIYLFSLVIVLHDH